MKLSYCKFFTFMIIIGYSSWANAQFAANFLLNNTSTLSYMSFGTLFQETKSISVKIGLVSCAPVLITTDTNNQYQASTAQPYTAQITACSNGQDTYTITTNITTQINNDGSATIISGQTQNIILGASIATGNTDASTITFPFDQLTNSSINGLEVGDTVEINSEIRDIISLSDTDADSSIVLDSDLSVATLAALIGMPVSEVQDFSISVLPGVITDATAPLNLILEITASNSGASDTVVTPTLSFQSGNAEVRKYMRNITTNLGHADATGVQVFNVNGSAISYFSGGVAAAENDVVEYLISVTNIGAGDLIDSLLEEQIPNLDLDLVPLIDSDQALLLFNNTTWQYLSLITTDRLLQVDNTTDNRTELMIDLGSSYSAQAGGNIAAGESWLIVYRVRIK